MNAVLNLYRSTIGKKVVMATTGLIMVGWLTAHMLGNLQVFLGPEAFNHYAELIQSQKELLWLMRGFMIAAIVGHVVSAIALAQTSTAARKSRYVGGRAKKSSTAASRTIRYGGAAILLFLLFHLADLTVGANVVHPTFAPHDAYNNLVESLSTWKVAVYILANGFLGLHLYHGVYSTFQTLGLNQDNADNARLLGTVFGFLIPGGNILIAVSIATGFIGVSA